MISWKIFIAALGLVCIIEGAVCFAVPDVPRKILSTLVQMPSKSLRLMGISTVIVGFLILWIASSV